MIRPRLYWDWYYRGDWGIRRIMPGDCRCVRVELGPLRIVLLTGRCNEW